jgi:hypothetical protein
MADGGWWGPRTTLHPTSSRLVLGPPCRPHEPVTLDSRQTRIRLNPRIAVDSLVDSVPQNALLLTFV